MTAGASAAANTQVAPPRAGRAMKSVSMNGATTTNPIGLAKMPTATGSAAHSGRRRASSARPPIVSASARTNGSWP